MLGSLSDANRQLRQTGAWRGRQDLAAGSGESWEASEQGSDLVRHPLEEVRLAAKSTVNMPLPPGTCRPWCPWLPLAWSTPSNVPAPTACPCLPSCPTSTPHSKVHPSTFKRWICCKRAPGSGAQPGASPGSGQPCPQTFLPCPIP